jgi:hypothetical protein
VLRLGVSRRQISSIAEQTRAQSVTRDNKSRNEVPVGRGIEAEEGLKLRPSLKFKQPSTLNKFIMREATTPGEILLVD